MGKFSASNVVPDTGQGITLPLGPHFTCPTPGLAVRGSSFPEIRQQVGRETAAGPLLPWPPGSQGQPQLSQAKAALLGPGLFPCCKCQVYV